MLNRDDDRRPTVALLAGLLCDEEIWQNVADLLAPMANVQIFCFPMFSSIQTMAEHVAAAIDGPFAIAGHSMGGRVALEIVRQFPRRVTGVALLNTGIHPPGEPEPANRGRLLALAREHGMAALAREWLPPMMGQSTDPDGEVMARLAAMVERQTTASFASQVQALLSRPIARAVLADLRVPVVLLSATEDTWSPPKQHEEMRQLCPGAELIVIERAGHMSPAEQPKPVAAALIAWLVRVLERERSLRQLSDLDRLLIADACTKQLHRLARLNDAGAFEAVSQLFTEDGMFLRPSDPETPIQGRKAILASLTSRAARPTRHVLSGVEVAVDSASRAIVTSTVVLYSGGPETSSTQITSMAVGTYVDIFCKVDGEWLISDRRGRIDMKGAI